MDKHTEIVCFGEVLWDVLPHGMKPGGAPLNVAYHLKRLGIDSLMISKVGRDEPGKKLLELMIGWGIASEMCGQDDQYPTSKVVATIGEQDEVHYEILFPVAWDYITWDDRFAKAVSAADALVFGSLAMRNEVSCETLFRLLDTADYRVFDVNLRYPFHSRDNVLHALKKTDLLKLNQHELDTICQWIDPASKAETEKVCVLQNRFHINEVLVTKGSKGASYYTDKKRFDVKACRVKVADTVGSGDAFLAAFLSRKFSTGSQVEAQLAFASMLGAFVAGKDGACPKYSEADLLKFKHEHFL